MRLYFKACTMVQSQMDFLSSTCFASVFEPVDLSLWQLSPLERFIMNIIATMDSGQIRASKMGKDNALSPPERYKKNPTTAKPPMTHGLKQHLSF